jgi:hypothetical protein
VCSFVWLLLSFSSSDGATASTQSQRAPITITQLKSTARSVPRRLTNSYTTGTIHTDHRTTQHYPITPITTTIMSEEEKTAPVVTEEPKVEEAAPAGEDAPAKEEESTATFEPVVRQVKFQSVIARRLEFPCRLYAGCRSGTAIHRSIAIYHLIPSLFSPSHSLCFSLSFGSGQTRRGRSQDRRRRRGK